ncbi:TPA: hypothetical protein QDB26_000959 [Burkholderia vietnamiensis]|nr:hypothetical protein [Burkholderia vietnamiensis]HDR9212277.1 hypothetical protein [Burkholderia vietnamiensis]
MTAGFQAFTDTGLYQIDGMTPNYQLVMSSSAASTSTTLLLARNDAGNPFYTTLPAVSFTFTANQAPMYGVYAEGGVGITLWNAAASGNTYTLTFITEQPCTVHFFMFDKVPPPSGNFGLQVFSANGTLIADSSRPFLRVLDVIYENYLGDTGWVTTGSPYPTWNSKAYSAPVIVSAIYSVHVAWSYDPAGVELTSIRVSGNTVSWGTTMYGGGKTSNFSGFREQYHSRFMVLDGTGIV